MNFKNPQRPRGLDRQGYDARRPASADPDRRRPGAVPCRRPPSARGRGRQPGHRAGQGLRRRAHQRLRALRETQHRARLARGRAGHRAARVPRSRSWPQRFIESKATVVCWAMGLTQHREAVATISEIVNVLLLQGNIGKPGAGPCPVRGHSNVQGDRSMGIWEKMPDAFLDELDNEFAFTSPREHGIDAAATVKRLRDGPVRVFFAHGWQLRVRDPGHRGRASRAAAVRSDRARVHQAEPVAHRHGARGADPADARAGPITTTPRRVRNR